MLQPDDHEMGFFKSFVDRRRRGRYLALLSGPGNRAKLLRRLCHLLEDELDPRFAERLAGAVTDDGLRALLVERGAGKSCHVISNCSDLDGQDVPLREGIDAVFGLCEGSILSCVAGRLAYFEREDPQQRFICAK